MGGRPKRRSAGFTLVEVIVALVVLVTAAVAFLPAFLSARQAVSRARNIDLATQSAHRELEKWRQLGYGSLPPVAGGSFVTQSFTLPNALPRATGQVTFTRVNAALSPTSSESNRRLITVTVGWTGAAGDRGSVTLTNLVTPD